MKEPKLVTIMRLKRRINTLENELKTLQEAQKDELYECVIKKLGEPTKVERLTKENKRLRQKIKTLKEIIKGDE